jgi:class 3 adenylate cyclase
LTILFADIRSFSRISEDADAAGVFHLLNEYLSLMEPLIEKHGGFVDKYIGDAIMAVFAQRPEQALAAATDMMRTLARYNLSRRTAGTEPVRIGIGIHHGPVILGTVGSRHRIETTAIGDTVNISARLESLSKTLGEPVLVSASVLRGLTDRQAFSFRYMDAVVLPGKSRPVEVYALQLQPDAHPDASPVAGATPTKEQDGKANSRETAE